MTGQELFENYQNALYTTTDLLERALDDLGQRIRETPTLSTEEGLKTVYEALVNRYGAVTAQLAVEFYDSSRVEAKVASQYSATTSEQPNQWKLDLDVKEAMATNDIVYRLQARGVQRIMERADITLLDNAERDPAKPTWGIVPQKNACGFCKLVASNGYEYPSKARAQLHEKRHPNCKCTAVVNFGQYDDLITEYQDQYYDVVKNYKDQIQADWDALSSAEQDEWKDPNHHRGAYDRFQRAYLSKLMK